MMKAVSLFSRKKTSRPFKDYYEEWIGTLKNTLIPLLQRSMSSSDSANLLTSHVEMIHRHFQSYYDALDLAASDDVAQILFPDWRNSLEMPFLWLGDFHPYLFTNLLRSFLNDSDEDDEEEDDVKIGQVSDLFNKQYDVVMAWKNPSKELMARIEQIECGLRLMVPALAARARKAQIDCVERVGADWGRYGGRKEAAKSGVGEAVAAQMDEMTSVVGDANRLRRSVLADIMSATSVYQAALFLDGLAQFVVGFRDQQLLSKFERCKLPVN